MNIKDLPEGLLSMLRERFEADPKVRELRVQQQMFANSGRFREALSLSQDIEVLYNKCVYAYMQESESEARRVDIADMDIPLSDKEGLMKLLLVCFMCADMIETSVRDMDDILHRHDSGLHVEMFDDIRNLMRMSKEKLRYLQENSGYMRDLVWGDTCDDMYRMVSNKAGAIMRKRKHDPDYGKNSERLNTK
jgi:hypothetical protein